MPILPKRPSKMHKGTGLIRTQRQFQAAIKGPRKIRWLQCPDCGQAAPTWLAKDGTIKFGSHHFNDLFGERVKCGRVSLSPP